MPPTETGASAGKPRSLVLAWAAVLLGLLSAVGYVLWAPPQLHDQGTTEVRISLSDIPTLTEDPPTKGAAGTSSAGTRDSSAIAVSGLPVTPKNNAVETAPSTQTAQQAVEVPQIAPVPVSPQTTSTEDSQSLTAPISPESATTRQPQEDERPKIVVVMSGLGLSETATETAIERLPSAVTLSFTPYGNDFDRWLAEARSNGHEVMIDLPMEPASFPSNDPGPRALITSLSAEENLARLTWILARGSDFIGVTGVMGSRFSASREEMLPILKTLKDRGLIYLDNRSTELSVTAALAAEIDLPWALNNRTIDESHASRVVIDARLAQIERVALTDGFAVAIAHPFPLTLERLAAWSETLDQRGFALVPISTVVDRQPQR